MKCREYAIWITRRLDGMLNDRESRELDAHLATCSRCRAEVLLQKRILESLKREMPRDLPDDFTQRVTRQAAALRSDLRGRKLRVRDLVPAFAATAGLVLFLIFSKDIAALITPAMETFGRALGVPLTSFGETVLGFLERIPASAPQSPPYLEAVVRALANTYVGLLVACATVLWALSRALAFIRE
jgi:anti-sigma factor RsiW